MPDLTDLDVAVMAYGLTVLAWAIWAAVLVVVVFVEPARRSEAATRPVAAKKPDHKPAGTLVPAPTLLDMATWIPDVSHRVEPFFYFASHRRESAGYVTVLEEAA